MRNTRHWSGVCTVVVGHIANPHKAHLGFADSQSQQKKLKESYLANTKKTE